MKNYLILGLAVIAIPFLILAGIKFVDADFLNSKLAMIAGFVIWGTAVVSIKLNQFKQGIKL